MERIKERVMTHMMRTYYHQLIWVMIAELFAALIFFVALIQVYSFTVMAIWLSLVVTLFIIQSLSIFYFKKIDLTYKNLRPWYVWMLTANFITGSYWGLIAIVTIPQVSIYYQAFIIVFLLGVIAAGNPFFSKFRSAYLTFIIPAFLPLIVWLALQHTELYGWLALAALVFLPLMISASVFYNKSLITSLTLQFRNEDLVDSLSETTEELKYKKRSLESSLAFIQATLDTTTDAIVSIANNGKISDYNRNFVKLWHCQTLDLKNIHFIALLKHIRRQIKNTKDVMQILTILKNDEKREIASEFIFPGGEVIEIHSLPQITHKKLTGRVWIFREITGRKRLEEKLLHQATHDELTNLINRPMIVDRIEQAIILAKQYNHIFAIMYIDIDRFKLINDSLGHPSGDEIIKTVAKRIQENIRDIDVVGRLGSDEFMVIFTSLRNHNEIHPLIRRIFEALDKPLKVQHHELHSNVSAGICFYPKDGEDPESLLKNADTAMFRAKEIHANSYKFYTMEMNNMTLRRLIIESKLRNALYENEFRLVYQPILDLNQNTIIGAEALLRWHQKELGIITPLEFITIAEETGLIIPIGEWVFTKACQQVKKWQMRGLKDLTININISGVQITQLNFSALVRNIIEAQHIDPKFIVLELTETIFMGEMRSIQRTLQELQSLGIKMAIDDFGTGYSCLNYLRRFPINTLKIDQSFVRELSQEKDSQSVTTAIIGIAKSLNMHVLAEGVEEKQQLDFLKAHGCQFIQGYYISKPVPADEFEAFALKYNQNIQSAM